MNISRRDFLSTASATCAALAISPGAVAQTTMKTVEDPLRWVDPRIGTGGHGHCYPGASVPFGAVQLSPDTFNEGWDWCSGYHVSDSSIMGFSHTHLSGTGAGDLLDFLVMAGTGPAKIVPGTQENPEEGYRSRFDHKDELAEPGYYSVLLKDYGIRAELTATERTGLHKYTFPQSDEAYLIIDLWHGFANHVVSAQLSNPAPDIIAGGHITNAWGKGRHSYFTLQVSKKPTRIVFYSDDKEVPHANLEGANLKAVLYFKTQAKEVIYVKTGISGVSAEGAAKNLAAELPGWDFEQTRRAARDQWREQLTKIDIQTRNDDHKRVFYTALYHLSLGPTLYDDVDGQYRGMDNAVHSLPPGQHNFTAFSLWDTYRAAHPTYTLINPERVPQFVNTLIRMAAESPAGMPVWPLQGCETGTMTGYHSASVISEAINKGIPGIDTERAYQLMMKRAMVDNYRGLGYYRKLHYIPADLEEESVSKTFEYCYNDWAIAHVSRKLGKTDDAAMLVQRSTNYRNYFNPSVGFMQPKLENGSWAVPFDPKQMGHSKKWRDFTESNSWQTSFGVQHDAAGLINLFGGRPQFIAKLDELFNQSSDLPADAPPDIAGLVGQYAHGNEPSHHIAYLYVYAGAPYKTQSRVRSLLETMYSPNPDGMQGNEDVGQMSAWFVLSSLGFYPVDPVSGNYILGSPLFESAVIHLGNGRQLEIEVMRKDPSHQFIQAFVLNGKLQQRTWFNHSDIAHGGKLVFHMGPEANTVLGANLQSAPPSLTLMEA
jgi:predicted alpha-1,2-mannosidase